MTDKVQKIREEVEKLMYGFNLEADIASCEDAETEKLANIKYQLCKKILDYIDKVQEESVGEELEKAALLCYPKMSRISEPHGIIPADNELHYICDANEENRKAFKAGAKWQEEKDDEEKILAYKHGFEDCKKQMMLQSGVLLMVLFTMLILILILI